MSSFELIKKFTDDNKGLFASYFLINIFILFIETIAVSHYLSAIFTGLTKHTTITKPILIFICLFTFMKFGYSLRNHIYDLIVPAFDEFLKVNLYNNIIERYKIDFKELNLGYILFNFQHIPNTFNKLVIESLQEYIPNSIAVFICILYLIYINPLIGFVAFLGISLITLVMFMRIKESVALSTKEHEISQQGNVFIQDKLTNLSNIYTSGTTDNEKKEHIDLENKVKKTTFDSYDNNTITTVYIELISILTVMILFFLLRRGYINGSLKAQDAIMIILIMTFVTGYLTKISSNFIGLVDILGYIEQSNKFLDEIKKPENNEQNTPNTPKQYFNNSGDLSPFKGPIEFKSLNFHYTNKFASDVNRTNDNDEHTELFNDLNLYINPGSKIAIYGKSGAGKTTLIRILLGFFKDNVSGQVLISGTDIKDINVDTIRDNIAVVNQGTKLFDKSIFENIIYGHEENNNREQIISIINNLGIRIFDSLENGLDTNVGVNGDKLSGGQKQMISILRALLKGSPILLFDEPTSAMDKDTKAIILGVIRSLKDKTIIIITHDKDVKSYVDMTYTLSNGQLTKE